jgi:L-ascorbate metabolism protein UlaG (beta-lactamase superfamily)
MEIQLIRNATVRLNYAKRLFLTDPMLSAAGEIESFAGISRNPTVELPLPVKKVLFGIDAVLASHMHHDHFDRAALDQLLKSVPVYCQPHDKDRLSSEGFRAVFPIEDKLEIDGITIIRTSGRHGSGRWQEILGPISGFVLQAEHEPTLYWAGDTIWSREVRQALDVYRPEVILVHASGAEMSGSGPIVMNAEHVGLVCRHAPHARVVAIHMEALDHGKVSRSFLRRFTLKQGIPEERLLIPQDGETLYL